MTLPPKIRKEPKKEKRVRCPSHLKWVRQHKCCVPGCDAMPIEAAHVQADGRVPEDERGGMAMKAADNWVYSLCKEHHAESHATGHATFDEKYKIDRVELAIEFAAKSPHRMKLRKAA